MKTSLEENKKSEYGVNDSMVVFIDRTVHIHVEKY